MNIEQNEIRFIVKTFMFNLLGLSSRNIDDWSDTDNKHFSKKKESMFFENNFIYFHIPFSTDGVKISVSPSYAVINFQIEEQVFSSLIRPITYCIKVPELKTSDRKHIYKNAIEENLIASLLNVKVEDTNKVIDLIDKMKLWSLKSYEGKKVPYAFIIDSKAKGNKNLNYLEFLDSDFSATITDGISSIITLDLNCNFVDYRSVSEENVVVSAEIPDDKCVPLRFAQILVNYVVGNRIGVFLLVNGDILVSKGSEILFVHRNNKWINFSGERYRVMLQSIAHKNSLGILNNELDLSNIFSTVLDVSFSHSGGIIAVVKKNLFNKDRILSKLDDYTNTYNSKISIDEYKAKLQESFKQEYLAKLLSGTNKCISELTPEQEKRLKREFEKRFSKRMAVETLINNGSNNYFHFSSINRKLRAELIGMDGATILDENGFIIAVGAIIQNDKGSSGGGRGAAASKLSSYGGFATKISTDGYIELYCDGDVLYQIK